ncbi:unnamed protein product [Ceutorhynchus assimilis]|uniref:Myb/SANT-like DNA-binding domain-containing protein n=1 Tax=Ceutorhynchus assimilis TaxID=467358 RepID=A0A9N9QSJ6_9CUCU|nr:unnamed protein product [Ceutorhynchus assimilis]
MFEIVTDADGNPIRNSMGHFLIVKKGTDQQFWLPEDQIQLEENRTDERLTEKKDNMSAEDNLEIRDRAGPSSCSQSSKDEPFIWSERAVLLLLEQYECHVEEFKKNLRHERIWSSIAAQLIEKGHLVNGRQCSIKWSGLKRTYKNIKDQKDRSGASAVSWPFYSAMTTLLGDKAYMKPVALASSTRQPKNLTGDCSKEPPQKKMKPMKKDAVLKELTDRTNKLQESINEQNIKRHREKAEREERKAKQHAEKMEMQRAFLDIFKKMAEK